MAFAIGLALAELEELHEDEWLPAAASAELLPAGGDAIAALQKALKRTGSQPSEFVAKWKVGVLDPGTELKLLEQLSRGRWEWRLYHFAVQEQMLVYSQEEDGLPAGIVSLSVAAGIAPQLGAGPCVFSTNPNCNGWSNPWLPRTMQACKPWPADYPWPSMNHLEIAAESLLVGAAGWYTSQPWRATPEHC